MKDRIAIAVFALIFSAAMIGTASAVGVSFTAKFGVDVIGEAEVEYGDPVNEGETGDVKNGFSLALEGLMDFQSFMVGMGVSYLLPRGIDEDSPTTPDGKFSTLPIYAVLNVPFRGGELVPFIAVQLGYNFLFIDSDMKKWYEAFAQANGYPDTSVSAKGGLYYAFGGGLIFANNIQAELLYRVHKNKIKLEASTDTLEIDDEYSHVTLSIGYRF